VIKLSTVIPCYNEEKNIPLLLEKFSEIYGGRKDCELVLVDNGSRDDSARVIAQLLPKYSFARTVRVDVNQGYGFGILAGLRAARGDFVGWTHADLQTDPYDVMKSYKILEENGWGSDLYVKGNRRNRPLFDQFFTVGMGAFETLFFATPMQDICAQPNFVHRSFFQKQKNPPHDFSLDLFFYLQAKKEGLKIKRFPVLFTSRVHGESSWNKGLKSKFNFIKKMVKSSLEIKQGKWT
jgi:glycosyltransferase involved in cell wall biosynthesis